MSKTLSLLLLITAIFVSFTAGFFYGRNYNHSDVQLSQVAETEASIKETEPVVPTETTAPTHPTETAEVTVLWRP